MCDNTPQITLYDQAFSPQHLLWSLRLAVWSKVDWRLTILSALWG